MVFVGILQLKGSSVFQSEQDHGVNFFLFEKKNIIIQKEKDTTAKLQLSHFG